MPAQPLREARSDPIRYTVRDCTRDQRMVEIAEPAVVERLAAAARPRASTAASPCDYDVTRASR
jgi:hypothetical protein